MAHILKHGTVPCSTGRGSCTARRSTVCTRSAAGTTSTLKVGKLAQADYMELGRSGLQVPVLGVGAWSWGDRSGYWGYGSEYDKDASRSAFQALMAAGLTHIDTAEVYGYGKSEEFLGEFIREAGVQDSVQIATKFAPYPWRLTADSVPAALKASLARLQLPKASLYMIHWPGFLFNAFSNDAYVDGLVKCKEQGLTDAVGVSNFNAERIRSSARRLAAAGVPLASNQVQYSLLYRAPERNGVLEACRENGVTLVAYSPLCQGLLTGKYKPGGPRPYGPRGALFNESRLREVAPLISLIEAVGKEKGKSPAQVAINWCICKGTLPIPGAKNEKQLADLAGAVGWRLSDGEVAELDAQSNRIPTSLGAPFENW